MQKNAQKRPVKFQNKFNKKSPQWLRYSLLAGAFLVQSAAFASAASSQSFQLDSLSSWHSPFSFLPVTVSTGLPMLNPQDGQNGSTGTIIVGGAGGAGGVSSGGALYNGGAGGAGGGVTTGMPGANGGGLSGGSGGAAVFGGGSGGLNGGGNAGGGGGGGGGVDPNTGQGGGGGGTASSNGHLGAGGGGGGAVGVVCTGSICNSVAFGGTGGNGADNPFGTSEAGGAGGGGGGSGILLTAPASSSVTVTANSQGGKGGVGGNSDSGGGGGGGAGGYGIFVQNNITVILNAMSVQGGAGGTGGTNILDATTNGNGGESGYAIFFNNAGTLMNGANSVIIGGNGGSGNVDGDGGPGAFFNNDGAVTNQGTIKGGNGGHAGVGLFFNNNGMVTNQGAITGGSGNGNGSTGTGVNGGGAGVFFRNNGTVINQGTITGGIGTNAEGGGSGIVSNGTGNVMNQGMIAAGSGSFGGIGVSLNEGDVTNTGTIQGGASSLPGEGGVGIITGNGTIIDSGMIAGGVGSDGAQADAIDFFGGTNSLELQAGYNIIGNVVAVPGGTDILILGGSNNSTFDVSTLGTQYQNFAQVQKTGTSSWVAQGATTDATPWTVSQGTLSMNGTIGGNMIVETGARLQGNGTIGGTVTVNGTIAPGNSIGTLNVGNYIANPGSIYEVEINPAGQSDLINVTGTATLNGGTVNVLKATGTYSGTKYTIVTAAGGVTGTYSGLTQNLPFLSLSLGYDPNHVYLQFASNNIELADAASLLGDLNGESRYSREATLDNLYDAMLAPIQPCSPNVRVWTQGIGSRGELEGDDNASEVDRSVGGLFVGADSAINDQIRVGVMGGYTHSNMDVDADSFAAGSANYALGIYGGAHVKHWLLSAGGMHIWHSIKMNFAGNAHANDRGYTDQLFIEGGHQFNWRQFDIEPFANLAQVNTALNRFTGAVGVTLHGRDEASYSTLGVRESSPLYQAAHYSVSQAVRVGWQHAYHGVNPNVNFAFAGGQPANITGVPIARDAGLVDAGLNVDVKHWQCRLAYDGALSDSMHDNGVTGTITWAMDE